MKAWRRYLRLPLEDPSVNLEHSSGIGCMLVFVYRGKPENPEKNPRSKVENQHKLVAMLDIILVLTCRYQRFEDWLPCKVNTHHWFPQDYQASLRQIKLNKCNTLASASVLNIPAPKILRCLLTLGPIAVAMLAQMFKVMVTLKPFHQKLQNKTEVSNWKRITLADGITRIRELEKF